MQTANLSFVIACLLTTSISNTFLAPFRQQSADNSNHGLVLILSQDQAREPADSAQLKECVVHNPPLACVPITITLKNEGKETILGFFTAGCGSPFSFDLKTGDGLWHQLPQIEGLVCLSTVAGFEVILPGKSYVSHLWLADRQLFLDMQRTSAVLSQPGPYSIRVREPLNGCVRLQRPEDRELLDPVAVMAKYCRDGQWPKQPLVVLESNELPFVVTPNISK